MKLKPRQERFCQHYAETENGTASYKQVTDCSDAVAATMAWKWLSKVEIRERIAEIREENAELCALSREQMLEYASNVVMTPIGAIDEHSPLCEEVTYTEHGAKLKMFSKAAAFDKIAKMCGYYEPEKVEHDVSDELAEVVKFVTGARDE